MKSIREIFATMSQPSVDDLREYMAEKVASVNGIDKLEMSLNPIKMAIEVHATRKAFKLLSEILSEMTAATVKEVAPKDPRDSFSTKFYGKK